MTENLASESNAAKINQRFKELELQMLDYEQELKTLKGTLGNVQALIEKQNQVIAQLYVSKYGTGPTVVE